jgi:membrane-associated protease RseP (regulator of RpoE activity)
MGEAKLKKTLIAFHEAGHAVIARLHGVDIASISMAPGGASLPDEGQYAADAKNISNSLVKIVTFGRDLPDGPYTPTEEERAAMRGLSTRLWDETVAEVQDHWSAIERVAKMLLVGAATEAQIDHAIRLLTQ